MITLRGHHLINLYWVFETREKVCMADLENNIMEIWSGLGYSLEHIQNGISVLKRALNPNEQIRLVMALDDICKPCHMKVESDCSSPLSSDGLSVAWADSQVIKFYGLHNGLFYARTVHAALRKKGEYK